MYYADIFPVSQTASSSGCMWYFLTMIVAFILQIWHSKPTDEQMLFYCRKMTMFVEVSCNIIIIFIQVFKHWKWVNSIKIGWKNQQLCEKDYVFPSDII